MMHLLSRKLAKLARRLGSRMHRVKLKGEGETEFSSRSEERTGEAICADQALRKDSGTARVEFRRKECMISLRWFDRVKTDLRYAFRLLTKSPSFTLIAAGSLALVIGADATIFAVGNDILYGLVAVPRPHELRIFRLIGNSKCVNMSGWGEREASPDGATISFTFPYPMYLQLRNANHELGELVAFKEAKMNATIRGDAQRADVVMVSGNFFEQMQVRMEVGRPLLPSDDQRSNSGAVAVISDGLWERKFARSPAVLGQVIRVSQQPITVVGVAPRGFTGIKDPLESPDIFVPITMQPLIKPMMKRSLLETPDFWWVNIAARIDPAIKDDTAQAAFAARFTVLARDLLKPQATQTLPRLQLMDGSHGLRVVANNLSKPIYVLFGFTVLLLLLASSNVANLLLVRGWQRQHEINVRIAMGAPGGRIMQQLFTENLLLASVGGMGGLLISFAGRSLLPRLVSSPWETNEIAIPFDWRIFVFTLLVTFGTATLFGLLPAWYQSRGDVSSQLKKSTHQFTKRRKIWSGKGIVALQIALSTVLTIGAGIFLRTVLQMDSIHLGFDPDHVLMFDVQIPKKGYEGGRDVRLYEQIEQKIAALPGVESVAPSWMPLAGGSMSNLNFVTEDDLADGTKSPPEDFNVVGNNYFHTMRIPILAGRAFNVQDNASSPKVAVINEALAQKRFPNGNPIGKRFRIEDGSMATWIQVVGICGNTRYAHLKDAPPPVFYLPYVQRNDEGGMVMVYQIRTYASTATLMPAVRSIVKQADSDLPIMNIRTEREQINADMQMQRVLATLTTCFGALALLLASVGIYGIMAFTVAQRTTEMGIRLALGALPNQIRRMILRESIWIALAGLIVGIAGALALTRLVKSMLYGIAYYDPVTLGCAILVLFGVTLAASWLPARRAAYVEPIEALRHE